uniref:Uncharacterized protein n=1 Tax=Arundo donax TaxID=35708 RepID=A0A0A9GF71_ARUDO
MKIMMTCCSKTEFSCMPLQIRPNFWHY